MNRKPVLAKQLFAPGSLKTQFDDEITNDKKRAMIIWRACLWTHRSYVS